jgi:hypothetical protein
VTRSSTLPAEYERLAQDALDAERRLFAFLADHHWTGDALMGPDCGVRFNYRVGRFIKSYLRRLPWRDDLYYLQSQAYWILASMELQGATGDPRYGEMVAPTAKKIIRRQTAEGAWTYPNPEWSGRIATAEGTWASLGLLAAYHATGDEAFLNGAIRWHTFVERAIGFQKSLGGEAVNYFAGRAGSAVPNNSAFLLRFLGELAAATGNDAYLVRCDGLVRFLAAAQRSNGEFPYTVPGPAAGATNVEHFQCFQYNAFACLDLFRYRDSVGDDAVSSLIAQVLGFLTEGVGEDGHTRYECGPDRRRVTYHTAATAAAFANASKRGWPDHAAHAARSFAHLLSLQRDDGSFPHSIDDYGFLNDLRPYPRNLAMIAYHLGEAVAFCRPPEQARGEGER